MFGRRCVGISGSNPCLLLAQLIDFFYLMSTDDTEEFCEMAGNQICMDNMGKDFIVYFPKIHEEEGDRIER